MKVRFGVLIFVCLLAACSSESGSIDGKPLSTAGQAAPELAQTPLKPLNIVVFGGTSGIGLETVKQALARGYMVTSITRHPERMTVDHPKLVNLKGDITQRDSFNDVIEGKDAVISSIGLGPTRKEVTVYSSGMTNVLAAMQQFGVSRVISITGIGAGDSKGHGGFFYDRILNPLLLKTDYADKTRQEQILKQSEVEWTIVRPGFLTDDEAGLNYRVISNLNGVVAGSIARADVAHFMLAALEQGSHIGSTVLLSN
jgi:putative NADH-flavin reductase